MEMFMFFKKKKKCMQIDRIGKEKYRMFVLVFRHILLSFCFK